MNNVMVINGGNRLCGEIEIQGAKNSVLPILAATVINGGNSVIHNCPLIKDVYASFDILRELGCSVSQDGNDVCVNSANMCCDEIHESLMREMRSSVIFTGAVLARCKKAVISTPGGCELGPRPIDLHLKAFRTLGVKIEEMYGYIMCDGEKMHNADIYLDFPSVGATENIMLLASSINGVTKIYNGAREPEIVDLQNFLNGMGAKISGAGTGLITIIGVDKFNDVTHTVIGDRIVAATYLTAGAMTNGKVKVTHITSEHLIPVLSLYEECGALINTGENWAEIICDHPLKSACCVSTMPHPGFPTDAQALAVAMLCVADGTSIVEENMFASRYKHAAELNRMGADIIIKDKIAVIRGVKQLKGTNVTAYDLRGAAALIVAGLNADGRTTVSGLEHLDRGYELFETGLRSLGAKITRE